MDVVRFCSTRFDSLSRADLIDPVPLTIDQVRDEIRRTLAVGSVRGHGETSGALLGRMFQEIFATLFSEGSPDRWQMAVEPETLADRRRLLEHVYLKLLGPRLTAHQAGLQDSGAQVMNLWHATGQMADWVALLLESAYRSKMLGFDRPTKTWTGSKIYVVEQPVTWTFRDPEWTRPVQITGIPDAAWRNPRTGQWCVVEYRLGRTTPEADVAQACLYHFLLASAGYLDASAGGSMASVAFSPDRAERLFDSEKLVAAQGLLRALIGRMAGVLPGQSQSEFLLAAPAPLPVHAALGQELVRALESYGPVVEMRGSPIAGPAFLRYTLMPGKGVKVSSIVNHADNLQMRLGLQHTPMIQKVGGQLVVDMERPDREAISFAKIHAQLPADPGSTIIPLGVDLFGQLRTVDLAETAHLLVAGAAGSGKSEWLRFAIAGLLCSNNPQTLRLALIDPGRTTFNELKHSPFLLDLNAVVYPPEGSATALLDRLISEMEDRYVRFDHLGTTDFETYNSRAESAKPRIVCVCDQYSDLFRTRREKKEIEDRIRCLGARARAAGIHLIIATRDLGPEIVGGALKANLAGRVCFRTCSPAESNIVIGQNGAERLTGNGDFFWANGTELVRLQAPLLTPEERTKVLGWGPALIEAASLAGVPELSSPNGVLRM